MENKVIPHKSTTREIEELRKRLSDLAGEMSLKDPTVKALS